MIGGLRPTLTKTLSPKEEMHDGGKKTMNCEFAC